MRRPVSPLLHHLPRPPKPNNTIIKMTTNPQPQLPPLPEVERLAPGCIRILAGNPSKFTLQGTNTYLLGTGRSRLLIDTGEGKPSWIAALQRVLRDEGGDGSSSSGGGGGGGGATVDRVLLTHWHHDHTGGVADVLRAWPGARVHQHRVLCRTEEAGAGEERQQQEHEEDQGQRHGQRHRHGHGQGKVQRDESFLDIADGQQFHVPGATLTAVHTPGHTADHMVFVWEEEGALFTGDNVLGHGTSVFEDLGRYVASLERMRGLFPAATGGKAYPGHGAVVPDGPGKIAEYIRHRGQREEQVVQTLRAAGDNHNAATAGAPAQANAWTVMELVRSIYRDVPESLHPAAAWGVLQILEKLQREGRVDAVDDGEKWRLVGSAPGRSAL